MMITSRAHERVKAARALQQQQKTGRRPRKEPPRGGLNGSGYWPGMKVV